MKSTITHGILLPQYTPFSFLRSPQFFFSFRSIHHQQFTILPFIYRSNQRIFLATLQTHLRSALSAIIGITLIVSSATDLPLGSSPIASSAFVDRSQIASSAIIGFFHNQVMVGVGRCTCSVDVQSQASSFKQTINQRTKSRT
ncbi:hypothetical protein Hdeb2414_s0006g00202941 [Helianthus debilis subsp. tardiflorus]